VASFLACFYLPACLPPFLYTHSLNLSARMLSALIYPVTSSSVSRGAGHVPTLRLSPVWRALVDDGVARNVVGPLSLAAINGDTVARDRPTAGHRPMKRRADGAPSRPPQHLARAFGGGSASSAGPTPVPRHLAAGRQGCLLATLSHVCFHCLSLPSRWSPETAHLPGGWALAREAD